METKWQANLGSAKADDTNNGGDELSPGEGAALGSYWAWKPEEHHLQEARAPMDLKSTIALIAPDFHDSAITSTSILEVVGVLALCPST